MGNRTSPVPSIRRGPVLTRGRGPMDTGSPPRPTAAAQFDYILRNLDVRPTLPFVQAPRGCCTCGRTASSRSSTVATSLITSRGQFVALPGGSLSMSPLLGAVADETMSSSPASAHLRDRTGPRDHGLHRHRRIDQRAARSATNAGGPPRRARPGRSATNSSASRTRGRNSGTASSHPSTARLEPFAARSDRRPSTTRDRAARACARRVRGPR